MITEEDKIRMREACEVAKASNDTKCKVGALVYGMHSKKEGMKKISSGYNCFTVPNLSMLWGSFEWDENDTALFYKKISEDSDLKRLLFFHAEDSLYTSRKYTDKSIAYITKFPCYNCCRRIEDQGIRRVVTAPIYSPSKWEETQKEGLHYLTRSDVIVDFIDITMIDGVPHLTEDLMKSEHCPEMSL